MAKRKTLAQKKQAQKKLLKKENVTKKDLKEALVDVAESELYSSAIQDLGLTLEATRAKKKRSTAIEEKRRKRRLAEKVRKLAGEKRREAELEAKRSARATEAYLSFLLDEPIAESVKVELSPKPRLSDKQKKEVKILDKLSLTEAQNLVESLYSGEIEVTIPVLTNWVQLFPKKKASKNKQGEWEIVGDHLLEYIKKRCKREGRSLICNTERKFYGSRSK